MRVQEQDIPPQRTPDDEAPETPPDEPKPPPVQDPPAEPVEPPYVVAGSRNPRASIRES
jgi:hypothetical protein